MCHYNLAIFDVIYISNPSTNELLFKILFWLVFIVTAGS